MSEQFTISVMSLMLTLHSAEKAGLSRSELCKLAEIREQDTQNPDDRLPASVLPPILEAAVRHSGDELFWLKNSLSDILPSDNLFFYVVFMSRTLHEALIRAERFFSYMTDVYYPSCHITKDEFSIRFNFRMPVSEVSTYRIDYIFSTFKCFLELFAGQKLKLKGIKLTSPFLHRASEYENYFNVPVGSGQYFNELVYRGSDFNLPNAWTNHDPCLDKILLRQIESIVKIRKTKTGFIESLHMAIEKQLPLGKPELKTTASMLTMSVRTLQRRLTEQNTSFYDEVHEIRGKLAAHYLTQHNMSVAQIAYILGFKDSRSLSVAYQKWYGVTPTEYRRQHAF